MFTFEYRFCLVDVMIPVGSFSSYRIVAIYGSSPEFVTNCVHVQISRMDPTRRGSAGDADPPPPPTMAEVLMVIKEGRVRNENLLAQLVQQGARRNTECNNLNDFLRSSSMIIRTSAIVGGGGGSTLLCSPRRVGAILKIWNNDIVSNHL